MAQLQDKIKHALDEALILITGIDLLVGFQFRSVFEKGFEKIPQPSQYLVIVALAIMLIALVLVMSPVPFHRIVEDGKDTPRFHRYVRRVLELALGPIAIGLGLNVYVITEKIAGQASGIMLGLVASVVAVFFWYVFELAQQRDAMPTQDDKPEGTKLADKVDHVLTEARVILPGAHALLGFQFATVLVEGFEKLESYAKYLHLISLVLIALSTILLMAPAAYHRIVEKGEDTERFLHLAGRFVLAAMIPLALGVSLNFFVVVQKVTGSVMFGIGGTVLLLILFLGVWFGYALYQRGRAAV